MSFQSSRTYRSDNQNSRLVKRIRSKNPNNFPGRIDEINININTNNEGLDSQKGFHFQVDRCCFLIVPKVSIVRTKNPTRGEDDSRLSFAHSNLLNVAVLRVLSTGARRLKGFRFSRPRFLQMKCFVASFNEAKWKTCHVVTSLTSGKGAFR